MATHESSDVAGIDGETALEVTRREAGDHLRLCAEYDEESYELLYTADWLLDVVGGENQIEDISEQFHSYIDLDRKARRVLDDLPPLAGDVRANVTRLDNAVFVRYYTDGGGVFLTLDTEVDLTSLLDTLEDALPE